MTDYVSCAPEALNLAITAGDPPDLIEALRLAGPAGETIAEVFPAQPYRHPPPATLGLREGPGMERLLRQFADAQGVEDFGVGARLIGLIDAVLQGSVLFVETPDGRRAVYESYLPVERAYLGPLDPDRPAEPFSPSSSGPHLFLGSHGSFNYGHFLLEDLPRLKAVETLRARYPGETVTLVLTRHFPHIDATREKAIALFLGKRGIAIRFVEQDKAIRFPRLYVVTPIKLAASMKSQAALDHLDRTLRARCRPLRAAAILDRVRALLLARTPSLRLFIDRNRLRHRDLLNRQEILALLRRRGFYAIDPERMPLDRQVALFAAARIVVGIKGAGMVNTVFCRPGTPTVHLAPETFLDLYYWDLAANRRQPYHVLYGPVSDTPRPDHLRDFTIDAGELARVLDGIMG